MGSPSFEEGEMKLLTTPPPRVDMGRKERPLRARRRDLTGTSMAHTLILGLQAPEA